MVAVAGFYEERLAPLPERVAPDFPRFCFLNGERDEAAANNRRAARLARALVTGAALSDPAARIDRLGPEFQLPAEEARP